MRSITSLADGYSTTPKDTLFRELGNLEMPRKRISPKHGKEPFAPPELTGDAGGGFESSVGAFALVQLLTGAADFGDDLGRVKRVKFQTKDLGHDFDDIAVEFESPNSEKPRSLAVSSKRDRQVTRNGFSKEVVRSIWSHFTQPTFRRYHDSMLLALGQLANDVQNSWDDLWQETRALDADYERHALRLQQSSTMKQALFNSLHRPNAGASAQSDPKETVALVGHLRLRLFDFRTAASRDRARGIELCKNALSNPSKSEPLRLWETLETLANTKRQFGGTVDLAGLISQLQEFQLLEYPDFRADWTILAARTQQALGLIRTDIAGIASLIRRDAVEKVKRLLASRRVVALIGESGSGKSSLAKQVAFSTGRVIWLSADDLRSGTSLQHELADVLEAAPEQDPFLIIDAAERFDDQATQRCAALLGRLVGSASPRWRVILTSQANHWEDFASSLLRHGSRCVQLEFITMELPDAKEVQQFLTAVPSLRAAFRRPELQEFLRNLKALDWVVNQVRKSSAVNTRGWAGVSDVIDWLWKSWVTSGPERFARANLLKRLATLESEVLSFGVPLSKLSAAECDTLSGLADAKLVRESDDRVYFEHDLLADWARLRCLIEVRAHAAGVLAERSVSPRWHRAIQLYGQRLAETDPQGKDWHGCLIARSSVGEALAADLLLDAVCSAVNASPALENVWPTLAENDGALLTRLLQRFRHLASMPDPQMMAQASDPSQAFWFAANCRVARGPHWVPMLQFLYAHRSDVVQLAPLETANTCKLWLTSTPASTPMRTGYPLRREAAQILVELAREVQGQKAEGTHFHDDTDDAVFGAVLEAIDELPEDVSSLALELCRRRKESPPTAKRRKEAKQRQANGRKTARQVSSARGEQPLSFLRFGPLLKPWPDGPRSRVDDAFRKVCLNSNALQRMMIFRPSVARVVILALCIEPPKRQGSQGYWDSLSRDSLGIEMSEKWNGPIYFRGPFLAFLRIAPKYGLDLLCRKPVV